MKKFLILFLILIFPMSISADQVDYDIQLSPNKFKRKMEFNPAFSAIATNNSGVTDPGVNKIYVPKFSGAGIDDATSAGTFTGTDDELYEIVIDATGVPDSFKWRKLCRDNVACPFLEGITITGSAQTLSEGVTVTFAAMSGHTFNDEWTIFAHKGKTYPFMSWADETNDLMKQRNAANTAWINLYTLSTGVPVSGGGGGGGVTDHGLLTGLGDDDHSQYHTDGRGDARYFQKSEFKTTSAGAGDSGKPVKLDAGGHVDASMVNDNDIDHNNIGNNGTNTHAQIDTHIGDPSAHHTATVDTNADTFCVGATVYLSGAGGCNDLDTAYLPLLGGTLTGKLTINGNVDTGFIIGSSGNNALFTTTAPGVMFQLYRDVGGTSDAPMMYLKSDNIADNQPLMRLEHDGTGGGAAHIQMRGTTPQIEWIETDQSTPAGKFETSLVGDFYRISGRNSGDSSFERIAEFSRLANGGRMFFNVGTGINEFSIDGTMGGNSDDAVPTEKAIVTFVNSQTHDADTTLNLAGAETITGNWVNTTSPWADNEVADNITVSNYFPLSGGTLTGSLFTDEQGIEFGESDDAISCSPGEYKIFADLSETTLKKCLNGVKTDLDTGGGGGDPDQNIWSTITPDSGTSPVPDTTTDALSILGGAGVDTVGDSSADSITLATDSQEANFLADGGATSLTCGSSNQGKMQVMDDGTLEYCDGATTSVLRLLKVSESKCFILGDESTAITTGTAKLTWHNPYAMVITDVKADLTTASSSGNPEFNIKDDGSTIFATNLTIDSTELRSIDAATAFDFVASAPTITIASDSKITFDFVSSGTGSTGPKICFIYHQ